jgi:hypothetical protein
MASLDVSPMISDFFEDPSRTALELPHLTTGQRKVAKQLLEQYPTLRCESYGFGAERRLHIFKEAHGEAGAASPENFLVNNHTTLIDETTSQLEPALGRSVPVNAERGALDFASLAKLANQKKLEVDSIATVIMESDNSPMSCNTNSELIMPLTRENLEIRNTFIHFGDTRVDERAVQSMPHGMFKQCLLTEAAEALKGSYICNTPTSAGGDTPTFSESEFSTDRVALSTPFSAGVLVQVDGLVKLPAYNGCSAVVQGWDEATERYSILIACPGGVQQAKIKEENLSVLLPCP